MKTQLKDSSVLKDWVPTEVHNWEGKERDVLVLNYTLSCPLSCNFCCYGCHPKRNEKMPIDLAKRLIREASELEVFSSVGFTGGEPMLFYEELVELGKLLKNLSLPFTIATAGHWASSQEESDRKVEELKKYGLLRLNISHDPSHAKFVPSENIIRVIHSAIKFKVATYIVGTFFTVEESIQKMLPNIGESKYIHFINKYVAQVGRASKRNITQSNYGLDLKIDSLCCYRRVNHDLVVFYDGEAFPCCSTFNRDTKGISLGNANQHSLKELWEQAEGRINIRVMKRQGFGKMYEIIKRFDSKLYFELPQPDEVAGPCSLCNKIYGNAELSDRVNKVFEKYEQEKIDNALNFMINKLGPEKTIDLLNKN